MIDDKYIGIPFKIGGRDFDGLDCWGLVQLFKKEVEDIELPSFTNLYDDLSENSKDNLAQVINEKKELWKNINYDDAEFGDVLVFLMKGIPIHVGTYIGEGKMIHILKGISSCIENVSVMKYGRNWKKRLIGVYRYANSC